MLKHLRRAAVTAVALLSILGLMAPSMAVAATNLPNDSRLGRWWLGGSYTGTGVMPIKNSSGAKVGEYDLEAEYYSTYTMEITVCVKDTLANGRGVIARVMVKYATNSSKEIGPGKFKGGSARTCYHDMLIMAEPMWALDVDHGEDWSGTPYQYTGYFDRYVSYANPQQRWPGFAP